MTFPQRILWALGLDLKPTPRALLVALIGKSRKAPDSPLSATVAELATIVGSRKGKGAADDQAITDAARELEAEGVLSRVAYHRRASAKTASSWLVDYSRAGHHLDESGERMPVIPEPAWKPLPGAACRLLAAGVGPWAWDVWCQIALRADADGNWSGSYADLARVTGMHRTNAMAALERLTVQATGSLAYSVDVTKRPHTIRVQVRDLAPTSRSAKSKSPQAPTSHTAKSETAPAGGSKRGAGASKAYPLGERGWEMATAFIPESLVEPLQLALDSFGKLHPQAVDVEPGGVLEEIVWPMARACKAADGDASEQAAVKSIAWELAGKLDREARGALLDQETPLRSIGGWITSELRRTAKAQGVPE